MKNQTIPCKMYGDDSSLPILLCIHGFLGDKDDWFAVADELRGKYRILAVDLPGHGDNHPNDWNSVTFRSVADDLENLLNDLDVSACPVLGYSMGGRLALYFGLTHPDRCKGLILESASPGLPTEQERTDRRRNDETLAVRLEEIGTERFVEEWYQNGLFSSLAANESLLRKVIGKRSCGDAGSLAGSLRTLGTGSQPSLWQNLGGIDYPVLLLAGESDAKYSGIAGRMAPLFQQADVCIIQGAGHNIHLERPGLFADVVYKFLNRADR